MPDPSDCIPICRICPYGALPDDDAVVDGECVGGEAGDVPGADGHLVAQDGDEVEVRRARNALLPDGSDPGADLVLTEGRGEGAEVGHLPRGHQDVARQVRVFQRQVLGLLRPSTTQLILLVTSYSIGRRWRKSPLAAMLIYTTQRLMEEFRCTLTPRREWQAV